MKKTISYSIVVVLILALLPFSSFASKVEFSESDYRELIDEKISDKQSIEDLSIREDVSILLENGFSKDEIFILGSRDVPVVANLIKDGNFTDAEIETLKEG